MPAVQVSGSMLPASNVHVPCGVRACMCACKRVRACVPPVKARMRVRLRVRMYVRVHKPHRYQTRLFVSSQSLVLLEFLSMLVHAGTHARALALAAALTCTYEC